MFYDAFDECQVGSITNHVCSDHYLPCICNQALTLCSFRRSLPHVTLPYLHLTFQYEFYGLTPKKKTTAKAGATTAPQRQGKRQASGSGKGGSNAKQTRLTREQSLQKRLEKAAARKARATQAQAAKPASMPDGRTIDSTLGGSGSSGGSGSGSGVKIGGGGGAPSIDPDDPFAPSK
jgi:hypothetical protein